MTIIVILDVSSPSNLTLEEIEKDLRMAEDQIGWNYYYVIKSVQVFSKPQVLLLTTHGL